MSNTIDKIRFVTKSFALYIYKNFVAFSIILVSVLSLFYTLVDFIYLVGVSNNWFPTPSQIDPELEAVTFGYSEYLITLLLSGLFLAIGVGLLQRKKSAWWLSLVSVAFVWAYIYIYSDSSAHLGVAVLSAVYLGSLFLTRKNYTVSSVHPFNWSFYKKYLSKLLFIILIYVVGLFLILKRWSRVTNELFKDVQLTYGSQMHLKFLDYYKMILLGLITLFILYIFFKFLERYYTYQSNLPIEEIKKILSKNGSDSLDYFVTNYKKTIYQNDSGMAGYTNIGNLSIFAGDSISDRSRRGDFVKQVEQKCFNEGRTAIWLAVSQSQKSLLSKHGYNTIKIGEEAVINLQQYELSSLGSKGKNVRRSERLMSGKNIEYKFYYMRELPAVLYAQLKEMDENWRKVLGNGSGRERGFSMTLSRLPDYFDTDVGFGLAIQTDQVGRTSVIAYITVVPVYNQNSYSLDMMRRQNDAPNGINEYLINNTILTLKNHGRERLSLNFAPLSNSNGQGSKNMQRIVKLLPSNIKDANYINSLYDFNEQFKPVWDSRYIAFKNYLQLPQIINAISKLER